MDSEKIDLRGLVLKSKPINLYGYTIIIFGGMFALGIGFSWLTDDVTPGILLVVAITCAVPVLGYLLRFFLSRNNSKLRERIEKAPSDDEAFSLIIGGIRYGFLNLVVMAVVFYISLKSIVL